MSRILRLLMGIGEIDELFIEEAETLKSLRKKQIMKYGTLAAAASVGLAVTYFWVKARRAG